MTRVAQAANGTPVAPVPTPAEAVRDEFVVRISGSTATSGAWDPDGLWVGRLRRISAAKLRVWGLAPLLDDTQLLVSELVTNALRYGRRAGFEFRLVITGRGMLLAVDDGSDARPRLRAVDEDSETGRGLCLVSALSDRWGVSPDGTTTWCTLSLPDSG